MRITGSYFLKNSGFIEPSQVSNVFQGKKNLIFKLGGFQQFENNQFSQPILKSQISKISIFFLVTYFVHYFLDKIIDFEYIFSNL